MVNRTAMARPRRPITLQEAADRLGVHYMTAYRYVRTGRLPARREGVQWMVDPAELARMRPPERTTRGHGTVRSEGPAKLAARMVAGDEAGAWSVVEAALASGVDPADVYLDLLVPALEVVGEGWAAGELTVADEHRATAIALRLVGRLGPRFARRGRKRGTVVVGAPAGEQHGIPSAILADLLRGVGFEVLDMGANTPAASFVGDREGGQPPGRDRDRDHDPGRRRRRADRREGASPGRPRRAGLGRRRRCPTIARTRSAWVRTTGRVSTVGLPWWRSSESHVRVIARDPGRISSPTSPRQGRMIEKVGAPEGEHVVLASSAMACAMRRKMSQWNGSIAYQ